MDSFSDLPVAGDSNVNFLFRKLYLKLQLSFLFPVFLAMSDLSTEGKIPLHLHYKSSEAVDEDFFSPDSRNPCLIHLHQSAKTVS